MLHSSFLPLHPVTIVDKDLENCINSCIILLSIESTPTPDTIRKTLDQLEIHLQQYSTIQQGKYFRILKSKQAMQAKKTALIKLMGGTLKDISGGIHLMMRHYRELYMAGKMPEVARFRCAERFQPMFDLLNNVLNEMIRINAYKDDVKDILKHQLALSHMAVGHFHFCTKNNEASIFHLYEKLTLADSIVNENLKESLLDITDIFYLATAYVDLNDLPKVASILRLEREKCAAEPFMYYEICNSLASKYAILQDYPNAIYWYQEAMQVVETAAIYLKLQSLQVEHMLVIKEKLELNNLKSVFAQESLELSIGKAKLLSDFKVTIRVEVQEWSPELIARLKALAGHFSLEFSTEELTVHKLSKVSIAGLTSIIRSIKIVEQEYHKRLQDRLKSPFEQPIQELIQGFNDLMLPSSTCSSSGILATPSSSSSSSYSSSYSSSSAFDPFLPASSYSAQKSRKVKTRGKAYKQRAIMSSRSLCDAEKYGFSPSLFGMHAFHECRMRGDSNRVFYVVADNIEASNKRGDNTHKFTRLISDPKIVPPCGEEGFKWLKLDNRQVLVGKVLDTKERLFPKVVQRNEAGAIAFLYGRLVNTKKGIPTQCVKHYAPMSKKPQKP